MIDAVGMEAHGSPSRQGRAARRSACCRTRWPQPLTDKLALDRLDALHTALKAVRRGGTVSISGVYGGEVDPLPMMEMFDRGMQLRMGQCHVKRWIDDIMPLVLESRRPLGSGRPHDSPSPPGRRPGCLRSVPEEGGRLPQGRAQALTASTTESRSACSSASDANTRDAPASSNSSREKPPVRMATAGLLPRQRPGSATPVADLDRRRAADLVDGDLEQVRRRLAVLDVVRRWSRRRRPCDLRAGRGRRRHASACPSSPAPRTSHVP